MFEQFRSTAHSHVEDVAVLAQRICEVSAPTGDEGKRAELWLHNGVDEAMCQKLMQ